MISDRYVYTDEAARANRNAARDNDVRGDEDVLTDLTVVSYVVAGPERDVTPDAGEGLDGIVLEDELVRLRRERRESVAWLLT